MKPHLLIVANAPSANTRALAEATLRGALHPDLEQSVTACWRPPLEASAADVAQANAIIIGTTENFGNMSGQIKDFFERIYYPCLETTAALPWALYIRAGKDGTGTDRAIHAIVSGMRWREMQPPLLLHGDFQPQFSDQCKTLGMTMAALIAN
ncbi:MAG: flavodoxin family protein [Proteobacteria bacterium]|nr:flavodoxin family protein [Pseudomonadota bacterium]